MFAGYKTFFVNGLVVFFMALRLVFPDAEVVSETAIVAAFDAVEAAAVLVVGLVNIVLRAVTTTPIFKSK